MMSPLLYLWISFVQGLTIPTEDVWIRKHRKTRLLLRSGCWGASGLPANARMRMVAGNIAKMFLIGREEQLRVLQVEVSIHGEFMLLILTSEICPIIDMLGYTSNGFFCVKMNSRTLRSSIQM